MSDTPRTDALVLTDDYGHEAIHDVEKIRGMEKELAAVTAERDALKEKAEKWKSIAAKAGSEWAIDRERAERAESDAKTLQADAERYRKLKSAITVPRAMQSFVMHMGWHPDTFAMGIDEAIDAAIAKE